MAKVWPDIVFITILPTSILANLLLWPPCKDNEDTILVPGLVIYSRPYEESSDASNSSGVILFLRDCRFRTLKPFTVQNHYICEGCYLATDTFSKTDVELFVNNCNSFEKIQFSDENSDSIYESIVDEKLLPKIPEECNDTVIFQPKHKSFLDRIQNLNLSHHEIYLMDNPRLFSSFKNLMTLNLDSNHIDNMHADVFKKMTFLLKLTLSHNRIKIIPETLFQDLSKLKEVDLSYNYIEYMPAPAFHGTALENLNLSYNKLKYLPTSFFLDKKSIGASLKSFYFDCNPWYCGCLNDILVDLKKLYVDYNLDRFNGVDPVCLFEKTGTFGCNRDLYTEHESNQCVMFSSKPL